jgi:hypothetical protein
MTKKKMKPRQNCSQQLEHPEQEPRHVQADNKPELYGKKIKEMELPILSPPISGSKVAVGAEKT